MDSSFTREDVSTLKPMRLLLKSWQTRESHQLSYPCLSIWHFLERVRLYEANELEQLLVQAGFVVGHKFGDYTGAPLSRSSPRVLLMGERL